MYVVCLYVKISLTGAFAVLVSIESEEVSGLAWLEKAQCSGYEEKLIDCPALSEQQFQKCTHLRYAGVKCANQEGMSQYIFMHTCFNLVSFTLSKKQKQSLQLSY